MVLGSLSLPLERKNAPGDLEEGAPEVKPEERPDRGLEAPHLLEALVPVCGVTVWYVMWCGDDGLD
jgi:hypothetical protein